MRQPALAPKAAFLHVINDHRWLVVNGCSWNLLMANNGANCVRRIADRLLPDVIVAVRDCALLQARSLIDFYTKPPEGDTNIFLCDFDNLSVNTTLQSTLQGYKKSIEVHLLHLTAWRDTSYRTQQGKEKYMNHNWNKEVTTLVDTILEALKEVSGTTTSQWAKPFEDLCRACGSRYRDKSFPWPTHLGEKSEVEKYLTACGL